MVEVQAAIQRTIADEQVAEVIERTLETTPADATHRSLRSMAKEAGLSHSSIWRIRGAFGLQPNRSETFKLSSDPALRGQGPRHHRPLSVASRPRVGALCRREEPDPGPRPHPAGLPDWPPAPWRDAEVEGEVIWTACTLTLTSSIPTGGDLQ